MALGNLVSKLQNMYVDDQTNILPKKKRNHNRGVHVAEGGIKLIDIIFEI